MTRIINNPKITNEEIVNVNRNAIEHRATWMGISYTEIMKEGADGEKILRSAIAQTGCQHGALIKDKINKPVKLDEFADAFLTPVNMKTFEMEFQTKTRDALENSFSLLSTGVWVA